MAEIPVSNSIDTVSDAERGVSIPRDLTAGIDRENKHFTSSVRLQLSDLSPFPDSALEWLMVEHYQFSFRNTSFLLNAADTAGRLRNKGVRTELLRNYNEESGHAQLYKNALLQIGTDVKCRSPFPPTEYFFHKLSMLFAPDPSRMLGAIYSTETAAIFEHEVFRDVSQELALRRGIDWNNANLKSFHDMHLCGVEQSHKDELGVFLKDVSQTAPICDKNDDGGRIHPERVNEGAHRAILTMTLWWDDLLSTLLGFTRAA